jgi:hypothetical protein
VRADGGTLEGLRRGIRERLELTEDFSLLAVGADGGESRVQALEQLPTSATVRLERTVEAEAAAQIKQVNEVRWLRPW